MNYETATDFELNKRLAELLALSFDVNEDCRLGGLGAISKVMLIVPTIDSRFSTHDYVDFNPCNNWNDIMPIAVELGVTLIPDNCLSHFAYYKLELDVDGYSSELCEYDSSPQRALVICCIKVLEAQK